MTRCCATRDRCALTHSAFPCAPRRSRFVNRDDLDLASVADVAAAQELELAEDSTGFLDYILKQNKFQNVSSLTLHVTEAVGGAQSAIQLVHLKGTSAGVRSHDAMRRTRQDARLHNGGTHMISRRSSYTQLRLRFLPCCVHPPHAARTSVRS